MSTHALVGFVFAGGEYQAASVHYDGYPANLGPRLMELFARDGVVETILTISKYKDWSNINRNVPHFSRPGMGSVAGYGERNLRPEPIVEGALHGDGSEEVLHHAQFGYFVTEDNELIVVDRFGAVLRRLDLSIFDGWSLSAVR